MLAQAPQEDFRCLDGAVRRSLMLPAPPDRATLALGASVRAEDEDALARALRTFSVTTLVSAATWAGPGMCRASAIRTRGRLFAGSGRFSSCA
jgi:hypothetical protein